MKKLALAVVFAAVASVAQAQIANSPHDFTDGFTGNAFTATVGACTFCHAPHNSNTSFAAAPLWNRPSIAVGTTYIMYTSATIDGPRTAAPGANSLTCLTCHDGGQAIAVIYNGGTPLNVSGNGNVAAVGGTVNVGTVLTNDHPVGITYSPGVGVGLDATLRPAPTNAALRLYNYGAGATAQVECGTCHDPHDNTNGRFLRTPNTAVALCGACHTQ
jgi:predicted CXXCH cytochrome family protein